MDSGDDFKISENAAELIASDSTKTWKIAKRFNDGHRMNMGDCFLSYRVTYSADQKMYDNNLDYEGCGESMEAQWNLIENEDGSFLKLTGEKIPTLFNIDQEYKYFKINALSENELVLQFRHRQFSSRETIIIDHLVPENIIVTDRDFHN
ncbi:MAG: lipocalin family protein [Flavobacteriaceae bacterium]|nr:lipocalin family protein [Flavobacteriaceae bacterium]